MHCKLVHLFTALLLSAATYAQACSCAGIHQISYFYYEPLATAPNPQQLDELLRGLNGQRLYIVRLTGYASKTKGKAVRESSLAEQRARQFRAVMVANDIPAQIIEITAPLSLPDMPPKDFTDGIRLEIGFAPDCACPVD